MSVDVDWLRKLLGEATPGPWGIGDPAITGEIAVRSESRVTGMTNVVARPTLERDASLIVEAVNVLPELLDRLAQAEAERERLRDAALRLLNGLHGDDHLHANATDVEALREALAPIEAERGRLDVKRLTRALRSVTRHLRVAGGDKGYEKWLADTAEKVARKYEERVNER